jgi:predicted enzyme related to lactoylglutathione lyase
VHSVPEAVKRFQTAGGRLAFGPLEIPIGRCAVVCDPWGNPLVRLDVSKGALRTGERGNVID